MEKLIDIINSIHPLSESSLKELIRITEIEEHPSRYKLIELDKKTNHFYFLLSGIARAYTISINGKESNSSIFLGNNFISSFSALINKTPSKTIIECLTNCKIAKCNYLEYIKLADKHIDLNIIYRKSIEHLFYTSEVRDIEFATMTATERYLAVKNRIPQIDNLISQKHIASHLGITSVQLSRLKKKLLSS